MFQNSNISKSIIQPFARVFKMHPVSRNRAAAGREAWNGLFVVISKAVYTFRSPRSAGAQVNLPPTVSLSASPSVSRLTAAPLTQPPPHPRLVCSQGHPAHRCVQIMAVTRATRAHPSTCHVPALFWVFHVFWNNLKSWILRLSHFPDEETEDRDTK